jgi:uncharacterized membrane protein
MNDLLTRLTLLLNGDWRLAGARVSDARWSFAAGGATLLAVGAAAAVVVAIVCYRRTTEGLTMRSRVTLATLRVASLLVLLVMASGAVCAARLSSDERPRLLVVVDNSPSMTLPSAGATRAAAAKRALEDDGLLDRLRKQFEVGVTTTSGIETARAAEDGPPQGLAAAIVRRATAGADRPAAHVLLVSDGVELGSAELSRARAELPAPVSALAVGADDAVIDLAVQGVSAPPFVYHNDRALVTADVRCVGYAGDAAVQLLRLTGSGETQVADARVALKAGDDPVAARLQFVATAAGVQRYKVRVVPVAGEATTRNNEVTFHLDVRPEKIRVLFVEGEASWEYKFVKQALERDPAVEICGLVRLPGDEWVFQGGPLRPDGRPVIANPRGGFPASADELNFFDVLILGDLERKVFEQGNRYEMVDAFVRTRGGGLMTIGGLHVYGAGDYAGTPLAAMLPFEVEKEKKEQLVNRFTPAVMTQGLMHPAMQLELDPVLNAQAWAKLPWVEGGSAIRAAKPAATLLMVHPTLRTKGGPRPVAAAWQYGGGRVMSSALDGTWHWRTARETEADYHARYWGLSVRWLAPDPRSAKALGALTLEDPVLEVAKPATFSLMLRDENGAPVADATADFTVTGPAGKTFAARAASDPGVPGRYALSFTPVEAGEYAIATAVARPNEQPRKQERRYVVAPSRAEFMDVRADAKALADLAAATGGTSLPLAKHRELSLPQYPKVERSQFVVVPLWHSPALMVLLIVTLSAEWLMRKRRGLS